MFARRHATAAAGAGTGGSTAESLHATVPANRWRPSAALHAAAHDPTGGRGTGATPERRPAPERRPSPEPRKRHVSDTHGRHAARERHMSGTKAAQRGNVHYSGAATQTHASYNAQRRHLEVAAGAAGAARPAQGLQGDVRQRMRLRNPPESTRHVERPRTPDVANRARPCALMGNTDHADSGGPWTAATPLAHAALRRHEQPCRPKGLRRPRRPRQPRG